MTDFQKPLERRNEPVRGFKGKERIKYTARRYFALALYFSGAYGVYRRLALQNRVIVLMYHRVIPWDEGKSAVFDGMQVEPATFERQMAYLRKHFNILALDELRNHLRDRIPLPPNSCLVTFDDGWKDNYTHAFPILIRYEVPAVIFLSVGHVENGKRFWQERTFAALCGIREAAGRNPDPLFRYRHLPGGINIEQLAALPERKFKEEVRERIRSLKRLPLSRIEQIVGELALAARTDFDGDSGSFLSWEEIREMSRGGIDFGSHGFTHEILTNISAEEVRREAVDSRNIIEEKIRKRVYAFSYPNGDHDPVVRRCVKECGYEIAFGTERGFAGPGDDPFTLKRVNVHDDVTREVPMFLSSILGMF